MEIPAPATVHRLFKTGKTIPPSQKRFPPGRLPKSRPLVCMRKFLQARKRIAVGKAGLKKTNNIMQVTSTANVSNVSTGTTSNDTVSGPQQTLTQNNFLQLLVAQMENQDPMNPQSDTEMASQM